MDIKIPDIRLSSLKDNYKQRTRFGGSEQTYFVSEKHNRINYQGFHITVENADIKSSIPYRLAEGHEYKAKEGVGIFTLPTQTHYKIVIHHESYDFDNQYFTVEMYVGDKKVIINNDKHIYYNVVCEVCGMKTNSTDSFLFYSPSKYESLDKKKLEKMNKDNIIRIQIKVYKREKFVPKPKTTFYNPNTYKGFNFREKSNKNYSSFGNNDGPTFTLNRNSKISTKTGTFGGDFNFGGCGGEDEFMFHEESVQYSDEDEEDEGFGNSGGGYSGGMTLSGGKQVKDIKTTSTKDKFTLIKEFKTTIQLVCYQSDEDKFIDNMAVKYKDLYDMIVYAKEHEKFVKKLQQELEEFNIVEMKNERKVKKALSDFYIEKNQNVFEKLKAINEVSHLTNILKSQKGRSVEYRLIKDDLDEQGEILSNIVKKINKYKKNHHKELMLLNKVVKTNNKIHMVDSQDSKLIDFK